MNLFYSYFLFSPENGLLKKKKEEEEFSISGTWLGFSWRPGEQHACRIPES